MIASLLPLPPRPMQEMEERDNSTSNLGISNDTFNDYEGQLGPMDEARYESAKWWRRLNRWMSLVGALIIAAIVSFSGWAKESYRGARTNVWNRLCW